VSGILTYAADPHEYGPGKTHIVNDSQDKTLCGKHLSAIPGNLCVDDYEQVVKGKGYCRTCHYSYATRPERERRERELREENAAREREAKEESERWWREYNVYLLSVAWREKRAHVLERAGYKCEGCGVARATQVHHLTYKHVRNEFLFELKAVCDACHERAHEGVK
jgi:hypothetical protein